MLITFSANTCCLIAIPFFLVPYEVVHCEVKEAVFSNFILAPFENHQEAGRAVIKGCQIVLQIFDIRNYENDDYKAVLVSSNKILVELPSVSRGYVESFDNALGIKALEEYMIEEVKLSHNVLRNQLVSRPELLKHFVLLVFPKNTQLTNERFMVPGSLTEFKTKIAPYKDTLENPYSKSKSSFSQMQLFVLWQVKFADGEARFAKKASGKKKGVAELEELWKGMEL